MRKNIIYLIVFIIVGYQIYSNSDPWRNISPAQVFSAVLSTDGTIMPGHRQDFAITLFREVDGNKVLDSKISLVARIRIPYPNGSFEEETIPLLSDQPGKYSATYLFPEEIDLSKVSFTLYPKGHLSKPIMTCNIPVKKEMAILVQVPQKQVYLGESISFKLVSVEKKTGLSLFKIPIRVKMQTPSGYTTLNRVVTTDIEGITTFETKIHPASPQGYYTFSFESDTFRQNISLYIKDPKERISEPNFESTTFYTSSKDTNETCGFIFNLNCETTNSLMAYGCPDSDYRQIEIWQNGKLHYFANLDLEGGTVSLILQKPLLAGCPTLFKVWQMTGNQIKSHEKIRYLNPTIPTKASALLAEINAEFYNTEKDRLALGLSRKAFIGASSKFKIENLTQEFSQSLKSVQPNPQSDIPLSYYEKILKDKSEAESNSEFFMVEQSIRLNPKKNYRVLLDSKCLLDSYIKNLKKQEPSYSTLLEEGVCRADKYPLLDSLKKKEETQYLEALLIPLAELNAYFNQFPKKKKKFGNSLLSTVNKIRNRVFVPAEFVFEAFQRPINYDFVPNLEIKPGTRSLDSIQGLLRKNGKIQLTNDEAIEFIELNENIVQIPSGYTTLKNLRSLPIIVESY